jgi:quercetin dioxygenase-like cupin family protein
VRRLGGESLEERMADNSLDKWHVTSRLERFDFYGDWLAASEHNQLSVNRSPVVARGRDLKWVETPNEHRIAMLIGQQVGFPTQGTNICKVAIPAGHHTGRHVHGEEAIHILGGSGFIVVDGRRYDFHEGTTIHVPYRSEHQLFNTGADEVTYISGSAMDLDLFVKLGRLEQLEEKGANAEGFESAFPAEDGQFDELGRRIALHLEDAPDEQKRREEARKAAAAAGEHTGHDHAHGHAGESGHGNGQHGHGHGQGRGGRSENPHRHGAIYILMGGGESPSEERNGFTAVSVAMTNIFEEVPHTSSHCHSHTEAMLYVLEGVGFSEIDYQHYDWEAGDAVHVPPKMTRHEHFNPSDSRTRTLRIEFGIRYFYEPLWQGYEKVEHRETAIARP